MRALVVDDSSAMRAYLKLILKQAGLEVCEARNGKEGLMRLQGELLPDLVLLDWNMPEMDGLEMLRQLRAAPRCEGV